MAETKFGASKGINNPKWFVLGVVLLGLVVVVFALLNHYHNGPQEGTLVIKAGDTILGSFTIADLRKLPAVEKKMVVQSNCSNNCSNNGGNSSGDSSTHHFTATPLSGVLNSIDSGLTKKYAKVITRGVDYYSQVLEMSEVLQPDNVYIAYADNGKPLRTKAGGEGSLQLIICSDKTGQRFTKWLVSLELQ
jgi:DMSO/TMAO reductase YedYZ molybdopterin-dependent catalytic subunit